jgi:hypothetical protein
MSTPSVFHCDIQRVYSDVRWSGGEQGWAAYPLFNVVAKNRSVLDFA